MILPVSSASATLPTTATLPKVSSSFRPNPVKYQDYCRTNSDSRLLSSESGKRTWSQSQPISSHLTADRITVFAIEMEKNGTITTVNGYYAPPDENVYSPQSLNDFLGIFDRSYGNQLEICLIGGDGGTNGENQRLATIEKTIAAYKDPITLRIINETPAECDHYCARLEMDGTLTYCFYSDETAVFF